VDLSIIIPCYNEAENVTKIETEFLPVLAELARTYAVEVIFVDDGSRDDTWDLFRRTFDQRPDLPAEIRFKQHPHNLGLGAALRTGFAVARGELVVTTDSDGTYRFANIPAMLARLTPAVDIVTASPYHPEGGVAGVPAYRLILSRGSSTIYRLLVDWRIHTYTCLVRVYRRPVIKAIPFAADGFLAGTELMVKAMLRGYRVAEYPDVLHRRAFGVSKAKLARTILAHLRFQGRVLLHRLHLARLDGPDEAKERPQWA
jgi:dolichol-phosphate mannosyltransferase